MGIIVKEGVANGRLTSRNSDFVNHTFVHSLCNKHYCSPDAIAISYILHQEWSDVILSGASTKAQLESNCQSLSIHLTEDELIELNKLQENSIDYWKTRSQLTWN